MAPASETEVLSGQGSTELIDDSALVNAPGDRRVTELSLPGDHQLVVTRHVPPIRFDNEMQRAIHLDLYASTIR